MVGTGDRPDRLGTAARRGIADRVHEHYGTLTPQERAAADVLLDHVPGLDLYSATEIAVLAGVSKATVSRLYRRLGYAGADEVRQEQRSLRAAGTPVAAGVRATPSTRLQRELANLARCLERAEQVLPAVAALLAGADRVVVVGSRSGRPLAELLRQQLVQARPAVDLAPAVGHTLGEELAGLGAGDVVVLLGVRRRPAGFERVVQALQASPARAVLVGDPSSRRWAGQVDHWLECPVDTGGAFDSHAPAAALVAVLADAVLTATGAAGARRVAGVDRLYRELGELEGG